MMMKIQKRQGYCLFLELGFDDRGDPRTPNLSLKGFFIITMTMGRGRSWKSFLITYHPSILAKMEDYYIPGNLSIL